MAGGLSDYKLKFVIDADGRTAKQELNDVYKEINKLGGGLTGAFGGAIPVAGAITGAIAGFSTALFALTKNAAEFGSTIHDASIKTGLGAETISSIKFAADQSGTSLEQFTGGIAKFSKTVGEAGDGSDKAAAKLKALGIDPQAALKDLDSSLGQVIKRIGEAKPGVEQITLAQKAFGKSGADLIPLMEQVGYNLDEFKKKAKELGITIDDDAAAKADEFGDTMDQLQGQIAGVGRTIATALMPQFTKMASDISDFLTRNQTEIQQWGTDTANVLIGLIRFWNDAAYAVEHYSIVYQAMQNLSSGTGTNLMMFNPAYALWKSAANYGATAPQQYGPHSYEMNRPLPTKPPGDVGGGGKGKSPKEVFKLGPEGQAFVNVANKLGIRPLDLATIVGFETAGTYSTSKTNSVGRFGLIQFGKDEASQFGAFKGQGFEAQLEAAGRYLSSRFASVGKTTAGASLIDLYRTVLGGNPNASLTRTDAYGTSPASGVAAMLGPRGSRQAALNRFFGGKESNIPGGGGYGDYLQEVQKDKDKEIRMAEEAAQRRIEIGRSMTENLIEQADQQFEAAAKANDYHGAMVAAQAAYDLKIKLIHDEIEALEERYQKAEIGSEEEAEAYHALELARLKQLKAENDALDDLEAKKQKYYENEQRRSDKIMETYRRKAAADTAYRKQLEDEQEAFYADYEKIMHGGQGGGDKWDLFGIGNIKSAAEVQMEQMQLLKDMTNDTFHSMAEAIGESIAAWALYGDSIGESLKKATAAILANLAAQAITEAIWETAQGFAMLALGFFGHPGAFASAGAHFTAAGIYAGIGAGAALGAKGLAGESFKGGGRGHGSGGGSGSQTQNQAPPSPYSRVSDNAFISGQNNATAQLAMEVRALHQKIGSQSPGNILVAGTREKRGHIAQTMTSEIKGNAGHGRELARSMGIS